MAKKLTKKQIQEAEAKGEKELPGSSPGEGFLTQLEHAGEDVGKVAEVLGGPLAIEELNKPTAAKKPKKKPDKSTTNLSQSEALQQLADYLSQSSLDTAEITAGQNLAAQNQNVTSLVDQQFAAAGADSGSPAVAAAMDAYQKAYSAGEGLASAGYAQSGVANAQYTSSAPLAPVINLLTQSLGSDYYKQIPASIAQGLPQSIRDALAAAGISETTGVGASQPISTGAKANTEVGSNLLQAIQQEQALSTVPPTSGTTNTNPNTPGA